MIGELSAQLAGAWRTTSWIELCAALLAVVYLVLAIRELLACWVAAFASSCLYVWVLFEARLYMESLLNVFYAAMAVYGYLQWRHGAGGRPLRISRWPVARHGLGLFGVVALSLLTSHFLKRYTPAAWPFADSMVTWSSVFATYLVARKVYENWHWWLVIDSAAAYLYLTRRLFATMLLFVLYLVLIVLGMRAWRRSLAGAAHGS